ncbi:MAG: DUF721 domain-containing protein [Saprospiraceae bacterium]|nr:DUF721 domain-containing protein [Saprospiraceae bacterium]
MQLVNTPKIKDKYLLIRIKESWKVHFGGSIEKHTTDIRFREGVLSLVINSAPLKHELSLGKDKIIRILNEALGQEYIKEVHIY